jgi:SAM-dependent methyltransferase
MRFYGHIDSYLDKLTEDIYPQPPDELQQLYGEDVIRGWLNGLEDCNNVLDVGCGQGQFQETFEECNIRWVGVTLGTDYDVCRNNGLNVVYGDFSFLMMYDNQYDLIFARHSLEHSPFPILTLMEWRRVSNKYLCVILPNPYGEIAHSHVGAYKGQNHYSVMTREHFLWLAERAGWKLIKELKNEFEMRFLLEKGEYITK